MALKGYFFNADLVDGKYDREYFASDFTKYLNKIIGSGVFPNPSTNLQVKAGQGMQVIVQAGEGIIDGHKIVLEEDMALDISPADVTLDRKDRIIMRIDIRNREPNIMVKNGPLSSEPVPPEVVRDESYLEYCLAVLNVDHGTTKITNDLIEDTRGYSDVCGWVQGLIQQVDTTTLFRQWQAAHQQFYEDSESKFDKFYQETQQSFDEWFTNIQNNLLPLSPIKLHTSKYTTIENNQTLIPIGIDEYIQNIDILNVYINGFKLIKDVDFRYDLLGTHILLSRGLSEGTSIYFEVLKASGDNTRKTAEQFAIKQFVQGNNLTTSDSADYKILENKIFGLSYQAGTPTPDSPQSISSLNTKVTQIISNKNILKNEFTGTKTVNGVTFTLQEDGGIKVKGTKTGNAQIDILSTASSYTTKLKLTKEYSVPTSTNLNFGCRVKTSDDTIYTPLSDKHKILNNSIQFVYLQVNSDKEIDEVFYPQIEYGTTLTEFIKNEQQKVEFPLTQSMYGIKVTSGGNYTDTYNQQWLCDSIEVYSDGTGKMIQRILKQPLLDLNQYKEDNGNGLQYVGFYVNNKGGTTQGFKPLCNRFKEITTTSGAEEGVFVNQHSLVLLISKTRANGEEAVKQWLKDNETYVLLGNGKSIETPLTPEQLKLFKDLKSYYPITNAYNLEGAGLSIKYFADTKTYIDNKFNILAEQLLNK